MEIYQHTIDNKITIAGIGLHSGRRITMVLHPAAAHSGIQFVRTDIGNHARITASYDQVSDTRLATTLTENGASVSTVEHLLAALTTWGVDNVTIEIDGPEVPIMDGSADPFLRVFEKKTRRRRQNAVRRLLEVKKTVTWQHEDRLLQIKPYDGFRVTCEIDFPHRVIRRQKITVKVNSRVFAREIAAARTFGFLEDIEQLRQNGLALGGSLENAVVLSRFGVINEEGLRFTDEFVRHKVLDLVGDLALFGYPLRGHVIARKTGHGHHVEFMRHLIQETQCWQLTRADRQEDRRGHRSLQPLSAPIPCMVSSGAMAGKAAM